MITALQNFISSRGKFVFVLLLIVVVVAFVLYLAQGASVFDLLPDPNREKKEFYGVDLNDPDQMRALNFQNRVASDFGAVIPPLAESIETADKMFSESLQGQLQAAFRAGRDNVDQAELQRLFNFVQSWPNLPKNIKVREIARAGFYEPVFSQASIKAMLVMAGQADAWNYLAADENHIGINSGFNRYVRELNPNLFNSEENRSKVLKFVAGQQGVRTQFVESSLFAHFRANQIDRIFSDGGFTLKKEGELDLFSNQFAWKADIFALKSEDVKLDIPSLFSIIFSKLPTENDSLSISYGSLDKKIRFVGKISDQNTSDLEVEIGSNISETISNLTKIFGQNDFDLKTQGEGKLSLIPKLASLPSEFPTLTSTGDSIKVENELNDELESFHNDHKSDPEFIEPSRTFATMVSFSTKKYLSISPEPDETRLRSYFDLNRDQFENVPLAPEPNILPLGEKGPTGASDSNDSTTDLNLVDSLLVDVNSSGKPEVEFEDFREEIRLRIIEEDRLDAERDARELAREASLEFLDNVNALRDKLRSKYSKYSQKRNSDEMKKLIAESGAAERQISFGDKDMGVQAAILGIERRESERRNNREPLEEVANLNESLFFTRSTRTIRDGFAVFILDRKTKERPGEFSSALFTNLFKGYFTGIKLDAFNENTDQVFSQLQEKDDNQSFRSLGDYISIDGKNINTLDGYYRGKNQRLSSRLSKLEDERSEISAFERDKNVTQLQLSRKKELDSLIENMRTEQDEMNNDRSLSIQLAEACSNLEVGKGWTELERTEEIAVFVRLNTVYSMKNKQANDEEIAARVQDLEFARAEKNRDLILRSLISAELEKK